MMEFITFLHLKCNYNSSWWYSNRQSFSARRWS